MIRGISTYNLIDLQIYLIKNENTNVSIVPEVAKNEEAGNGRLQPLTR